MSQQQSNGRTVLVQGRLVWGISNLFSGKQKVDMNTRQPMKNQTTGEPIIEYGFGLAVPKESLQFVGPGQPGEVWGAMHEEAFTLMPNARATGQIPPAFAMKYKDGDGIDDQGRPFRDREGYAGHIVLSCTTRIPIKWFKFEPGVGNVLVNEGIKVGDYVKVQLQVKAHPAQGQGKAGLYLNPSAVQLLGYGSAIINTPSGDDIFGTTGPALPQGASAMPTDPSPGQMLAPPPGPAMPAAPSFQQAPPAAPQPHYGVLPPAHQPPAGGMPMAPGAPHQPGNPQMPGFAPAVAPGYPAANPGYPAPAAPAASPTMPGPTGYPPAAAPTAAYPGSAPMPQMPGYPQQR